MVKLNDRAKGRIVRVPKGGGLDALRGASCAFGVFDGVHIGHKHLLASAIESARMAGGSSVALTFEIDPDELFAPNGLMKLLSNEQRLERLSESGVDIVAVLPFDRQFASLEPDSFLEWAFRGCEPSDIHVGEGFRFGRRASGTVDDLRRWGHAFGVRVHCHELVSLAGEPVSATRIRGLLSRGECDLASRLLGR